MSVFISYRRGTGEDLAEIVESALKARGYSVFRDRRRLESGPFDLQLLSAVDAARDFVVILTPGALDRCHHPQDWVRLEISQALSRPGKNIVPVHSREFVFPKAEEVPAEISGLLRRNAVQYEDAWNDAALDRLCKFLKSRPWNRWPYAIAAAIGLGLAIVACGICNQTLTRNSAGRIVPGAAKPSAAAAAPADTEAATSPMEVVVSWHGFVQRKRGADWIEDVLTDNGTLYSGDQFRIVVTAESECYLYVVNIGSDGTSSLLFPPPGSPVYAGQFRSGQTREVPPSPDWFTLDHISGQETMILLASSKPLDDLQRYAHLPDEDSAPLPDPAVLAAFSERFEVQTRNVTVQRDRRVAEARLHDGRVVRQAMTSVAGADGAVKVIRFEHRAGPAAAAEEIGQ